MCVNESSLSSAGRLENVTFLIDIGADVHIVYENEKTAVHWAALNGLLQQQQQQTN